MSASIIGGLTTRKANLCSHPARTVAGRRAQCRSGNWKAGLAFLQRLKPFSEDCAVTRDFSFDGWSWSAIFVGAIVALVFQILLVMAGFGVGLLAIDIPTADAAPKAISWAVFCWWAVSGVISAFAGGWAAANFSETFTAESRAAHGLIAWAVATLMVVGVAGLAATNSVASDLAGPTGAAIAQYRNFTDARAGAPARPTQAQLETARR